MRSISRASIRFIYVLAVVMALPYAAATKPSAEDRVRASLKYLNRDMCLKIPFKKKTHNEILGTDKSSEGKLFLWNKKMRIEVEGQDRSLLVMDGKYIWFESSAGGESQKLNVAKSKMASFGKANQALVALFDAKRAFEHYKLNKSHEEKGLLTAQLKPKKPKETEIEKLEMVIETKTKLLKTLKYWDDRENEVEFTLGEVSTITEKAEDLFIYHVPKGAEVTEF